MNFNVTLDSKSFLAIGVSAIGIIFALKSDPTDTKEVLIKAIDAYANLVIVDNDNY